MTDVNIGKLIHDRRIDMGFTMKELAERVGVSEATISRWESGEIKNMRRDAVANLAKALQVNPKVLMNWNEEEMNGVDPYYLDPETARLAQEAAHDPEFRILLDAKRDLSPEDMKIIIDLAKRLLNRN